MQKKFVALKYKASKLLHQHQTFVVLTIVLSVLIVVIVRINNLSNLPLDQGYLNEQTSQIKNVNFNQNAIDQIKQLNDSNVTAPGTELPSNRLNPFNE